MSLVQTLPFTGIQGTCNTTAKSIQTGVKGYAMLNNKAEMKNAIYYHGDISVLIDGNPIQDWNPSDDVSWPYFLGKPFFHFSSLSSPCLYLFSLANTDFLLQGIIR